MQRHLGERLHQLRHIPVSPRCPCQYVTQLGSVAIDSQFDHPDAFVFIQGGDDPSATTRGSPGFDTGRDELCGVLDALMWAPGQIPRDIRIRRQPRKIASASSGRGGCERSRAVNQASDGMPTETKYAAWPAPAAARCSARKILRRTTCRRSARESVQPGLRPSASSSQAMRLVARMPSSASTAIAWPDGFDAAARAQWTHC